MRFWVLVFIFASNAGLGTDATADTHQWQPDAVWYSAKADQLNQAVGELSAAEICGKDTHDPLPTCVPEHLQKAAKLISDSTADSESMVIVKTEIEEFSRNIQHNKNPIEYTYPVFSKNANPWFIALDKVRKKFRQKATDLNIGSNGVSAAAGGSSLSPAVKLNSGSRSGGNVSPIAITVPTATTQNPR